MKVWNIKYCLTSGIRHIEVTGTLEDKYVYTTPSSGDYTYSHQLKMGRDAFEKYREAFAAAEEMRLKKMDSLKKKIAELRRMKFKMPAKS